jgi:two-component sensor histidine kinase
LHYQKVYQVYQDSLVNKANIQKIEQLKSGYEIDKRESEIGLLNTINTNQRYVVVLLGMGVLSLVLFVYLLYRGNSRIKKTNSKLESQKKVIAKREEEKALLLRELNHRVKNNLQMISSLLNLQSRELTGHPAKEAILAGRYRVEALSLVHRKLYQEGPDTRVLIKEYMEELVLGLFHGYGAKFNPDFKISNISVPIDAAVPLALIVNELTINALKYAYTSTSNPTFKIQILSTKEDSLDLEFIDNGEGFIDILDNNSHSFGIKLIYSLVEQLEGSIEKLNGQGTHWRIHVKTG